MRETLEDLGRIPGVVGSLACGPGGELLACEFPPLFEQSTLRQVAAMLGGDVGLDELVGPGGSLDLGYTGGRAVVKPFRNGTLFVLCTPSINPLLLGMSLEHASRRLEKVGGPQAKPPPLPAAKAPRPAVPAHLARARDALSSALMRGIGPIAEVVFSEAWTRWLASGPPSGARLAELAGALAREIDDEEARARFLGEVAAVGTDE
jgi:hypothetical protein